MQRLLWLKQFSQNPSNFPNSISSISSPKPFLPSFSKTNPIRSHVFSPSRHSISQFFTSSSPSPNSSQSSNYILQKLNQFRINKGFLPYTTANTLLKGSTSKALFHYGRLGFPKSHFSTPTSFHRRTRDSWFRRMFTSDELVYGLIVANVAVFMLWRIADRQFMVNNFMISLDNFKSGRLHTLITCAFSHIEMEHIISNMIGLYFFGTSISRTFGPGFMLKLYLSGAVAGSVFYLVHKAFISGSSKGGGLFSHDPSRTPGLGASGAVNAIVLLDIFLFPTKTLYLEFIIPVPAILLGIFLIGHDMLRVIEGESKVSGSAHLGGAVVAALAWARLRKGRRFF